MFDKDDENMTEKMCLLNTLSRVRHWSCPAVVAGTTGGVDPTPPSFFSEAEDVLLRPLAQWEEKTLKLREERQERRLRRVALVNLIKGSPRTRGFEPSSESLLTGSTSELVESLTEIEKTELNLNQESRLESTIISGHCSVAATLSSVRPGGDVTRSNRKVSPSANVGPRLAVRPGDSVLLREEDTNYRKDQGHLQTSPSDGKRCKRNEAAVGAPPLPVPHRGKDPRLVISNVETSDNEVLLSTRASSIQGINQTIQASKQSCSYPAKFHPPSTCPQQPARPGINSSRLPSKPCGARIPSTARQASSFSSFISLFLVLVYYGNFAIAKQVAPTVCVADISINHKTRMESLKRFENCTVLEGSLQINSALFDYQKAEDHLNFSFPNLIEITDYLALFRANQIANLTEVLPKLSVIRGHRLINNYALAIYQMKNMRTLGLLGLTNIMKGGVRIEKNPSLCYVETLDWRRIVDDPIHKEHHIFIEENMDQKLCSDSCPARCENNCWDEEHCQIKLSKCPGGLGTPPGTNLCYTDNQGEVGFPCSSECLGGCTKPMSPEHCFACKNVWYSKGNNQTVCVDKCPGEFLSYKNWKCITERECSSLKMYNGDREEDKVYKIHTVSPVDLQCVDECPANFQAVNNNVTKRWECQPCENCPRHCEGGLVNSREEAEMFRHCTHISGNLEIRVSEGDITPVLEDTLKDIKEIAGTLKVSRSFALVSLYFLKSLELITGNQEKFTITIMENENLQKLFPQTVRIGKGKAFIHYNQKLCMEEINNFIESSGIEKPDLYEVSDVTNGNKAACSKEKLGFNITGISGRGFMYTMEDYRQNLHLRAVEDLNALIGYEIYYREITEEQYISRNVSKFEGLDACGGNAWNVIDRRPSDKSASQSTALSDTDASVDKDAFPSMYYEPIKWFVFDLKPYTPYVVYATTLMVPHLATNATGAQSDIIYFRTAMEPPEEVRNLKWRAESYSELHLSWLPPKRPHGIIDHYDIVLDYIPLAKMAQQRNYCLKKSAIEIEKRPERNEQKEKKARSNTTDSCPVCSCSADEGNDYKIEDFGDEHIEEQAFYSDLINKLFTLSGTPSTRRKRSIRGGEEDNLIDEEEDVEDEEAEENNYVIVKTKIEKTESTENIFNDTSLINGSNVYSTVYLRVPGNQTEALVGRLKHFALYQVKVMACQKERKHLPNCTKNCVMEKDCSPWAIEEAKTLAKPHADDIVLEDNKLSVINTNETSGETFIRWVPPADPNEMIGHYILRTASSLGDETNKNFLELCIPLSSLQETEDGQVEYQLLEEGEYWISLRAVSLHSPGAWTSWQWVKVNTTTSYTWVVILVLFVLLAGAGLMSLFIWRHKQKHPGETRWEIVSRNPDYLDTGFVYQMDDWEVSRDLIEKGEELGSGSFGVCHRGVYYHPDEGRINVAIKTVPEHATFRQRIEFLNEASVMKEINTAHVVKLLGVVSQGQPTLVLMELMENGDLRKYLRSLRPDNKDNPGVPPTLQRTLQMALEIADGMAYLSVRKFVHRDLAARNCMVSTDFVVKVGDFGMAQDVYEREYYRTEGRRLLPVRWMAPESLRDGKFTSKSDVWSYGVVLWEMATLAEQPYQGWSNDEVVRLVKDGNVMENPDNCPERLYELMRECWARNPDHRPSFLDICERLLPEASENFRENSFYLSSQGAEAVANQSALRQAQEETEHVAPLTNNGSLSPDNGHAGQAESVPMRDIGARSPTHVSFSNDGSRSSKISINGLSVIQRLRNKSGSTSGEA